MVLAVEEEEEGEGEGGGFGSMGRMARELGLYTSNVCFPPDRGGQVSKGFCFSRF